MAYQQIKYYLVNLCKDIAWNCGLVLYMKPRTEM